MRTRIFLSFTLNLDDLVWVRYPMGKDSTIGKVNRLLNRRFRGKCPWTTPDYE